MASGESRRISGPTEYLIACQASFMNRSRAGWMAWLEFPITETSGSDAILVCVISARSKSAPSSLAWTSSTQCKRLGKPFLSRAISIVSTFRSRQQSGTNHFALPPVSPRMPTIIRSSNSNRDEQHRSPLLIKRQQFPPR